MDAAFPDSFFPESVKLTGFPSRQTYCSDITNTLVGISGETVPEGGNLRIYCVQWCHLKAVVLNSQLVCHTTLLPHQRVLASTANFNCSEYFYKN